MLNNIQHTESGERLSFSKLFKDKGYEILIPIIQRDYAQGRDTNKEIRNGFISALKDYLDEQKPNRDLDFIYGSLVAGKDKVTSRFVPLDGQQRLTTLFLLHWYLASKEKELNSFRQVFAKPRNKGKWNSKFTYETRASASEFCDALVSAGIDIQSINPKDKTIPNLSETIKNQQWYFLSWRNDPTIQGMLVMLDDLHDLFRDSDENYYQRLTDSINPIITFQFLKLEEFGLTDDLYIKMNARGKPLTSFENFKAKLEKQIKQPEFNTQGYVLGHAENERKVPLYKYFSHKIDTDWANFFWAYGKDELEKAKVLETIDSVVSYDDIIMNFFKTYAINYIAGKSGSEKQVKDLIQTNSKELTYNQFKQYDCFDTLSIPKLIQLLDCLENQDNKARQFIPDFYYFNESILEKFLKNDLSSAEYVGRIMLHAYSQFLIHWLESEEEDFTENLKKWMRVIHNLTENTQPYNSEREFTNSIKGINEAVKHSNAIYEYLLDDNSISGFDKDQNFEERIKACLINRQNNWDALIYEAEQHGYFKGQIGFILRLSGVSDFFRYNKNCDWDEHQDKIFKQLFTEYLSKAKAVFNDAGLKSSLSNKGDYVWERALLTIDDYLIVEGRNKSFLVGSDRDISWKRFLKGDKEEAHHGIVKTIFDSINTSGIPGSLLALISESNVDGWRKAFIDTPQLFPYMGTKRYVRLNSNHGFVLFRGERMSGTHAELYSLKFHYDYLKDNPIEPFKSSHYYEPSGADLDFMPCATMSKWGDYNYELEVLFVNNKYEIWFVNNGSEPISNIISELLISRDFDMEPSEVYQLPGFVMNKDTDVEALAFINLMCAELNSLKL